VDTVLFVGAGRHQRRAILRARQLGLRVVAVDGNPDAAGLAHADVAEVADFADLGAVVDVARRHRVDGALTVAVDRAVPVVAAVAEELGLPGIGARTAHLMTHKVAMRRRLAEGGVPQPRFAAVRVRREAAPAAHTVGFPAVVKPADSSGGRGLFLLRSFDDLDRHLHAALSESPTGEAILESFTDGLELNGLVLVRGGEPQVLLLSDRLRPGGEGFGVGWIHSYPSRLFGDVLEEAERVALRTVRTLGLRDGIAFPQLIVHDGTVTLVEVAARVPGGQMADLAFHALGIDLVEIALRQALGEEVPDDLAGPSHQTPTAVRFLTARPGPLPLGKVTKVGGLERVLRAEGVVQADVFLEEGEVIRPVRLAADRRGYVIATGQTNVQALEAAETAARMVYVEAR
jgi:biotin carboxylase